MRIVATRCRIYGESIVSCVRYDGGVEKVVMSNCQFDMTTC